ncbi:hypothetical protein [Trichlorobacter ammonificans]|uniref:Uncharacterized protein n=1 Tax=Trichlorobacter ammonificans TaxID=2916410 RepID=A0ABM9D3L6_9BACT|nr:hypothetical protein [Trichlorobacter ammonificans]CAH2029848.1 protein of unknown function [Trichlorobacter ammonificans]
MAARTSHVQDDLTVNSGTNGTYTFMVTTFTVPGAADGAAGRASLLEPYDDLVAPISGTYGGAELDCRAGRTVSCFKHARDAVQAAVELQTAVDEMNLSGDAAVPVLARIALHTGQGFVDPFEQQWEGVAGALRCTSLARGGEVVLTDVTLESLEERDGLYCLDSGTVTAGHPEERTYTVHRMLWNPGEREVALTATPRVDGENTGSTLPVLGRSMMIALPLVAMLYLVFSLAENGRLFSEEGRQRTIHQRVDQAADHLSR